MSKPTTTRTTGGGGYYDEVKIYTGEGAYSGYLRIPNSDKPIYVQSMDLALNEASDQLYVWWSYDNSIYVFDLVSKQLNRTITAEQKADTKLYDIYNGFSIFTGNKIFTKNYVLNSSTFLPIATLESFFTVREYDPLQYIIWGICRSYSGEVGQVLQIKDPRQTIQ